MAFASSTKTESRKNFLKPFCLLNLYLFYHQHPLLPKTLTMLLKKLIFTLPLCLLLAGCSGQAQNQEAPTRLIVRADDIGFAHAVNHACIEVFTDGIARSVEVMVPGPWFPEAARLLRQHPEYDAGIHLVMTSEWENLKWRPLTAAKSISDENGYFYPMVWPNDNYPPEETFRESGWQLQEVEQELRAQIELAKKEIPHLSHVSTHMGFQSADPEIEALVWELAREYGLHIKPEDYGVQRFRPFDGPRDTREQHLEQFVTGLENLGPGTWLFVEHPGYDVAELQQVATKGNPGIGQKRQWVTDLFTHPRVKEVIARRDIELISYKDLKEAR